MRRPSLRTILAWTGLLVSAGFVYLALRHVHWGKTWDALEASDYLYLLPSLAILAAAVLLRVLRWSVLFAPGTRPPFGALTRALLIGYFFNNVLPARAGEVARVVALHQRANTSRAQAAGTVVAERAYDVLVLLLLLFAAVPFLPDVSWLNRAIVLAAALAVALVVIVLALAIWQERPVRFLFRPLARTRWVSLARTERAAENLVHGLAAFRRPALALRVMALTALSWLVLALSGWMLLIGFHLRGGFGAALLVVIATNIAMILPSSPGAIGIYEAATILALSAYGIARSPALSYALVLHAVNLFPYLVVGYLVLHHHALELRRGMLAAQRGSSAQASRP
jgi:uncharacterized protein (TIRG00374 family)